MSGITEYCTDFPKNLLARLVYNEVGKELWEQLEKQCCQLIFSDTLEDYWFTNITPDLQQAVYIKKVEALDSMKPD